MAHESIKAYIAACRVHVMACPATHQLQTLLDTLCGCKVM